MEAGEPVHLPAKSSLRRSESGWEGQPAEPANACGREVSGCRAFLATFSATGKSGK